MAQELNDGHYGELMDRLHVVRELISNIITDHPALVTKQRWIDQIEEIDSRLGQLYQDVGNKTHKVEEKALKKLREQITHELISFPANPNAVKQYAPGYVPEL